MSRKATLMLAEFAAGLRFEDLPERTRAHCKNLILDALASVLAGHQGEETGPVRALALALDFGSARKLMALLRAAPRARAVAAAE